MTQLAALVHTLVKPALTAPKPSAPPAAMSAPNTLKPAYLAGSAPVPQAARADMTSNIQPLTRAAHQAQTVGIGHLPVLPAVKSAVNAI